MALSLQHYFYQWVGGERAINVIKLRFGGHVHSACQADKTSARTGAHFYRVGSKIRQLLADYCNDGFSEIVARFAHDLDGKIAGEFNQRLFILISHSLGASRGFCSPGIACTFYGI